MQGDPQANSQGLMGSARPVIDLVTTATSEEERQRNAKIAVLPIGSFEQHGTYLPLITDSVVACAIASEVTKTFPVLLLPPVTISCSHEHSAWPGTVSIGSQTLYRIIEDVSASLRRSGIERLILINGHGGNYVLGNVVQEHNAVFGPRMSLFPDTEGWERARVDAGLESSGYEDMHAGEIETSLLLHVAPSLVRPGNETADHVAGQRTFLLTLGMEGYTTSGVVGRPSLGTAEKGKALLDSLVRSFGDHFELVSKGA